MTSRSVDAVDKWLSGDNGIPRDVSRLLEHRLGLPPLFFEANLTDLLKVKPPELTDESVTIKNDRGFLLVVNLNDLLLKKLAHFATNLSLDNAQCLDDSGQHEPDDHQ